MTTFDKKEVLKEFDNLYWVDPEGGSHHPVCVYKQEDEVVRGFLSTALTQAYEAAIVLALAIHLVRCFYFWCLRLLHR